MDAKRNVTLEDPPWGPEFTIPQATSHGGLANQLPATHASRTQPAVRQPLLPVQ